MFFILKGEVRVVTPEGATLATLTRNMHFGEMALVQTSVRSTSVVAAVNTVMAVLTVRDFRLICDHYPEFETRVRDIVDQRAQDSRKKGVVN